MMEYLFPKTSDWVENMGALGFAVFVLCIGLLVVVYLLGKLVDRLGRDGDAFARIPVMILVLVLCGGLLLAGVGFGLDYLWSEKAVYYAANGSDRRGEVRIGGSTREVPPGDWTYVALRGGLDGCQVVGALDGKTVVEEACGEGVHLVNLSGSQPVQFVRYFYGRSALPRSAFLGGTDDPKKVPLASGPLGLGVWMVTKDPAAVVYDFGEAAPQTVSIRKEDAEDHYRYDIQMLREGSPVIR